MTKNALISVCNVLKCDLPKIQQNGFTDNVFIYFIIKESLKRLDWSDILITECWTLLSPCILTQYILVNSLFLSQLGQCYILLLFSHSLSEAFLSQTYHVLRLSKFLPRPLLITNICISKKVIFNLCLKQNCMHVEIRKQFLIKTEINLKHRSKAEIETLFDYQAIPWFQEGSLGQNGHIFKKFQFKKYVRPDWTISQAVSGLKASLRQPMIQSLN